MIGRDWTPQGWTFRESSSSSPSGTAAAIDWIRVASADGKFEADVSRTVDVLGEVRIAVRAWDETREFRADVGDLDGASRFLAGLEPIPQGDLFAEGPG